MEHERRPAESPTDQLDQPPQKKQKQQHQQHQQQHQPVHKQGSEHVQSQKHRLLACQRCRNRKQKCDEVRPCSNCVKSGDECVPTEPAPRPAYVEVEYVRALEERIAELEARDPAQSQDHMLAPGTVGGHMLGAATPARPLAAVGPGAGREVAAQRTSSGASVDAQELSSVGMVSSASPVSRPLAPGSYTFRSPQEALAYDDDDSDTGYDYIAHGLVTSPSVRDDGRALSTGKSPAAGHGLDWPPLSLIVAMPSEMEDLLLTAYRERAQAQYPFFHWGTFLSWHRGWKSCPPSEVDSRAWQGFFVNLVYSTALLLLSLPRAGASDSRTFYRHGISLFPRVLRQADQTLHAQAYLLLSMHALHRSSTPRILSVVSTTMRYCVQTQLHLHETEPEPVHPGIRLGNQVRRRCFWSAYCLDRLVMASFELPPSISDVMVTCKLFSNIDDDDLEAVAARTPPSKELPDSPYYTCVSSSLHVLQCRRIQSEISGYTLRWDYKEHFEEATEWRVRILSELENYKSRVQKFSDPQAKGYTSQRWLAMIYHYALLTLYRPTKESVLGPGGDWSIQASSQACLIFRKSQIDRQIAQPWVALLVQFQSGITLLYCCWATPPEYRTENYDSPDVSDALRACSNILAIMTDRWPKADCLRDVFELLAREVPLIDRPSRPPTRVSNASAQAIREKLPQVRSLIVHRSIMRMIEEMITDDFPRLRGDQSSLSTRDHQTGSSLSSRRQVGTASPATTTVGITPFELPFTAQHMYGVPDATTGVEGGTMSAEELLSFPGMFDLDSWTR